MGKIKVILTDSNTLKQIRPSIAEIQYRRFLSNEIKLLLEYIDDLEQRELVEIENKIKRSGISYGIHQSTGIWFPTVEISSDAIIDVPYGAIAINISVANPTNKLDINDRENWDNGMFDLEARVIKIGKSNIADWKDHLFPNLSPF